MIKDTAANNGPDVITISIDRELALLHVLSFSAILSDLGENRPEGPDTAHEKDVKSGIVALTYLIEDILHAYLRPDARPLSREVANE